MALNLSAEATVYDQYAISNRFKAQNTAIDLVQGNISLIVSESETTELKNGNKTIYSKLSDVDVSLGKINLAVSQSEYKSIDGVLEAITQAKSEISLLPDAIKFATSRDELVSTINMAPDEIKIDAENINLTGNGLINILNTTGTTTISASRINLNGLVTANSNFKILTDGSIESISGKIGGWSITSTAIYDSTSASAQAGVGKNGNGPAFWAGGTYVNRSSAPFRVDHSGKLYSRNAELSGKFENLYSYNGFETRTQLGGYGGEGGGVSMFGNNDKLLFWVNEAKLEYRGRTSSEAIFEVDSSGRITLNGKSNYVVIRGKTSFVDGAFSVNEDVRMYKSLTVDGNLNVKGTGKKRVVETQNYGAVSQYCYETAAPMFGDIGEGITDSRGYCYIDIDNIFSETVYDGSYHVFLQKEESGDVWVEEKSFAYFIVKGSPNLRFSWELKAKQLGAEYERLEVFDGEPDNFKDVSYEDEAAKMVEDYYMELETAFERERV